MLINFPVLISIIIKYWILVYIRNKLMFYIGLYIYGLYRKYLNFVNYFTLSDLHYIGYAVRYASPDITSSWRVS